MGKSLICFKEESLWLHDVYVEPIIYFVSKAISLKIKNNEINESDLDWFKLYNNNLINLFMGASDGALDLEFDTFSQNKYRLKTIRNILITLSATLSSVNIELEKDMFDKIGNFEFGNYANWEEPINSKELASITDQFIALIKIE